MKKIKIQNIIIAIFLIAILAGFSYALIEFVELVVKNTQTISYQTANLSLSYTDCADTNQSDCEDIVASLKPGDSITKTFQIKNTGTVEIYYGVIFSSLINTFKNDELVYKVEDLNTGKIVLSERALSYHEIETTNEIAFSTEIGADETQRFKMIITFLDTGKDQSANLDATFSIKLGIKTTEVEWNSRLTLASLDLASKVETTPTEYNMFNYTYNGYQLNESTETTEKIENIKTSEGVYSIDDDFGTSYYFRGSVNLKNIVKFGSYEEDIYSFPISGTISDKDTCPGCIRESGNLTKCLSNSIKPEKYCTDTYKYAEAGDDMYWRIIRINGDGTLRLLYIGAGKDIKDIGDIIISKKTAGRSPFNDLNNDKKYAGFTYDNTAPNSGIGNNSSIKTYLEDWYNLNMQDEDKYIIEAQFYSDTTGYQLNNLLTTSDNLGNVYTYSPVLRLERNKYHNTDNIVPTLKTSKTTQTYGGLYSLKVGLINLDEMVLSGFDGMFGSRYFCTDFAKDCPYTKGTEYIYWSLNPGPVFENTNKITGIAIDHNETFIGYRSLETEYGVSPVINIKQEYARQFKGKGTFTEPYEILTQSEKTLNALSLSEEVKNEPTEYNMFNYTYNGYRLLDSVTNETVKEEGIKTTQGVYFAEDDFGISYYFRGSKSLNNLVKFGKYEEDKYYFPISGKIIVGETDENTGVHSRTCENCITTTGSLSECKQQSLSEYYCTENYKFANSGDDMYWRIIRINGDGTLRLLYVGAEQLSTNINNTATIKKFIGKSLYNLSNTNKKYLGYTYDNNFPNSGNGTNSAIKTYLENWFNQNLYKQSKNIAPAQFYDDTFNYRALDVASLQDSIVNSSIYRLTNRNDIKPSLKTESTSETFGGIYNLKIGLITADELTYMGYDGIFGSKKIVNDPPFAYETSDTGMWIMTSGPILSNVSNGLSLSSDRNFIGHKEINSYYQVRPVINLTSTVAQSLIGNGSLTNPYRLPE